MSESGDWAGLSIDSLPSYTDEEGEDSIDYENNSLINRYYNVEPDQTPVNRRLFTNSEETESEDETEIDIESDPILTIHSNSETESDRSENSDSINYSVDRIQPVRRRLTFETEGPDAPRVLRRRLSESETEQSDPPIIPYNNGEIVIKNDRIPNISAYYRWIKKVDFDNNNLNSMDFLTNAPYLESITITNNKIWMIPNSIKKLTKLNYLDLTNNDITLIKSAGLGTLSNLKDLVLDNNKLLSLPEDFQNLKIKHLHLSDNKFTEFPLGICQIVSLKSLHLSGNKITEIPECIQNLTELDFLDLSKNLITDVKYLPPFITTLYLYVNKITEFISDHPSLIDIDLSTNPNLTKVVLNCPLLENFTARDCKISEISGNFNGKNITLTKNFVENFQIQGNIHALLLDSNEMKTIPENIYNLRNLHTLILENNEISVVSPKISQLQSLHRLNLALNPISELPPEIGNLKNLEFLNLSDTKISTLGNFQSLKILIINNVKVKITSLPKNIEMIIGDEIVELPLDIDFTNVKFTIPARLTNEILKKMKATNTISDLYSAKKGKLNEKGMKMLEKIKKGKQLDIKDGTLKRIYPPTTDWMEICRNLDANFKFRDLQDLAKLAQVGLYRTKEELCREIQEYTEIQNCENLDWDDIFELTEKYNIRIFKTKRELCRDLSISYQNTLEVKSRNCENTESFLGDVYDEEPDFKVVEYIAENGKKYCFTLEELEGIQNSGDLRNPYIRSLTLPNSIFEEMHLKKNIENEKGVHTLEIRQDYIDPHEKLRNRLSEISSDLFTSTTFFEDGTLNILPMLEFFRRHDLIIPIPDESLSSEEQKLFIIDKLLEELGTDEKVGDAIYNFYYSEFFRRLRNLEDFEFSEDE